MTGDKQDEAVEVLDAFALTSRLVAVVESAAPTASKSYCRPADCPKNADTVKRYLAVASSTTEISSLRDQMIGAYGVAHATTSAGDGSNDIQLLSKLEQQVTKATDAGAMSGTHDVARAKMALLACVLRCHAPIHMQGMQEALAAWQTACSHVPAPAPSDDPMRDADIAGCREEGNEEYKGTSVARLAEQVAALQKTVDTLVRLMQVINKRLAEQASVSSKLLEEWTSVAATESQQ